VINRFATAAALLLATLSLNAQILQTVDHLERLDLPQTHSIADMMGQAKSVALPVLAASRKLQPNVVMVDDRQPGFLIPIAGNAPGANGTYFRSDVMISNYRSSTQTSLWGGSRRGWPMARQA